MTTHLQNSMQSLMQTLASKEPFYVRCIKPNEVKSPSAFDDKRVEHQIRSVIPKVIFTQPKFFDGERWTFLAWLEKGSLFKSLHCSSAIFSSFERM